MQINADSIGKAHDRIIREILDNHIEIVTEDGEHTIEYPEPIMVKIANPFIEPMKSESSPYSMNYLQEYIKQVCGINKDSGFAYTYGNRLFDYPSKTVESLHENHIRACWIGNGDGRGFDQISSIVEKLMKNPTSRRGIAHTWVTEVDSYSVNPPCLQTVQFLLRDYRLHAIATFRSNDMLMAWGCNTYALANLQMKVLSEMVDYAYYNCGVEYKDFPYAIGNLTTVSTSAHIYDVRDKNYLDEFRKRIFLW